MEFFSLFLTDILSVMCGCLAFRMVYQRLQVGNSHVGANVVDLAATEDFAAIASQAQQGRLVEEINRSKPCDGVASGNPASPSGVVVSLRIQ